MSKEFSGIDILNLDIQTFKGIQKGLDKGIVWQIY